MTRLPLLPPEKPLHWVGSAKKDYLAFPVEVQSEMGYALGLAQLGTKHPNAKPWKGEGPGVFEIVEDHRGDTYRAVYTGPLCRCGVCAACLSEEIDTGHQDTIDRREIDRQASEASAS